MAFLFGSCSLLLLLCVQARDPMTSSWAWQTLAPRIRHLCWEPTLCVVSIQERFLMELTCPYHVRLGNHRSDTSSFRSRGKIG